MGCSRAKDGPRAGSFSDHSRCVMLFMSVFLCLGQKKYLKHLLCIDLANMLALNCQTSTLQPWPLTNTFVIRIGFDNNSWSFGGSNCRNLKLWL